MTSEGTLRAPYPGLRSFRRYETELFFGRDGCINTMVDRLAATRFLAVLGSSGTGKSSLVRAGLLDALELGLMAQNGSRWCIVDFRPQEAPLRNLARRLLQVTEPQRSQSEADIELLRTFLARGPRSVIEWCRAGHLSPGENLLLLVDQFEELFRYQDYAGREEAEAFVALLIESAQTEDFPIYSAITMRSEYLGACALIGGLAEEINTGTYLTPRMTREQCREAIVGPARVCNIEIEEALINRLLNDLASFAPWDESGAGEQENTQFDRLVRRADQLPLLQYTLNRMWLVARERSNGERVGLSLADYKGLSFALNEHADQIYQHLNKNKRPVEQVFRALTSGTSIADAVRQPTRFDRLVAICGGDEEGVREVVDAYRAPDCNFLLPEIDSALDPATVIDISHESLIRQWKSLSEWLAKEALAAQQWRRLNDRFTLGEPLRGRELANMVAWREEIKPNADWAKRYGGDYAAVIGFLDTSDRAERKRRWLFRGGIAAVFACLVTAAAVTFFQWQTAKANLLVAQQERDRAESNYALAKEMFRDLMVDIAGGLVSALQVSDVTDTLRKARSEMEKLAAANPNDIELEGLRASVLEKFSDAYTKNNYRDAALAVAAETLPLYRRLVERDPDSTQRWEELATLLVKIGDLNVNVGESQDASANYQEALDIERRLARRQPENEDHQRQIAAILVALGDLRDKAGKSAEALELYGEAVAIRRKFVAQYFVLPIYRRDLSSSLDKIARLKSAAKDIDGALQTYREELAIDRQITESAFGVETADYNNISLDLGAIGELQLQTGDRDGAAKSYQEKVDIDRRLAERDPDSGQLQSRIARTLIEIGDLQLTVKDVAGAKKSYQEAFSADLKSEGRAWVAYLKERDASAFKAMVDARGHVSWSGILANDPKEALQYAEWIVKNDPSRAGTDINRAHAYLLLGRYDEAKVIYVARKDTKTGAEGGRTYADEIRDDFDKFRELGIATPDVDRIAQEIGL